MNVFECAQRIASDLAKQKENIMLEQLNELVSRGLLVCESNEPVLLMEDGKLLYKQMVRLKLRDQEYIEQLESRIKKLEAVAKAGQGLLKYLPNMEVLGAARYSAHLKTVMQFREALAELEQP